MLQLLPYGQTKGCSHDANVSPPGLRPLPPSLSLSLSPPHVHVRFDPPKTGVQCRRVPKQWLQPAWFGGRQRYLPQRLAVQHL